MLSWRYTCVCVCVCKCECLSVVCICSPRSLSMKTQLMSWIVVLKLKVLSCASESDYASLFYSSLNGNSLLKTQNCLILCSNEACGMASWTLSHGSVSVFNTCRKQRHTEIIPNNFVSNQAGFLYCYLSEGRQMRARDREKVASISCHVSCCVSKVHSIKASLTGVFLFWLCSRSNTLCTQLRRLSSFDLNAFWIKGFGFFWAKDIYFT